MIDDELAAVVVIESNVDTVVTESGITDTLRALADPRAADHGHGHAPHRRADVRVDRRDANPVCGDLALTFMPGNWSPQTITVRAAGDTAVEGFHFSYVTHTVASSDVFAGDRDLGRGHAGDGARRRRRSPPRRCAATCCA